MSDRTDGQQPQPSQQWQELKAKFEALCNEQEKIDTTGFAQVYECINEDLLKGRHHSELWPFTDDENILNEALEKTGHKTDKGFCDRFMRSYRIFRDGKEIQRQMMIQNAKEIQQPQPAEVAGWRFKPMANIIAPVELHDTVNDVLSKAALQGVFDSKTDTTEGIDELLDELMLAEAFNVRCSLTHYTEELRCYNIILNDGSFLNRDFTRLLLATLKEAVQAIKEHSDKPNQLKKDIAEIVKRFDDVPVWGIFFQILTLQGLVVLLEQLDINEGDTGFDEAQAFYTWLLELLVEKEYWFSCVSSMAYGDGDLLRLQSLCKYLMTTTAGEITQQIVNKPLQNRSDSNRQPLTRHFKSKLTEQQLTNVFDTLTKNDYLAADSDLQAWLWICTGKGDNMSSEPLKWTAKQNTLAEFVNWLCGEKNMTDWGTTKACFRVMKDGNWQIPNTDAMKLHNIAEKEKTKLLNLLKTAAQ